MKTIIFFITHKTLTHEHARATFSSLEKQVLVSDKKIDKMYIYNSHSSELTNEYLKNLYIELQLDKIIRDLEIFSYEESTHKSLGGDINSIRSYLTKNYDGNDRVLLLKSDCVLSKYYLDTILNLPSGSIYFVSPFICAKKRVTDDEIFEYANRDGYIASDSITYFVEDENNSSNNDFTNRKDVQITDESIKFTSCYVIRDFSCHYMTIDLMPLISISNQSWGGVNFERLRSYFVKTDRCFVIHKYHDIISDNRSTDREGPVKNWLNS